MIVLDTSFLVGALNERDAHHDAAGELLAEVVEGAWGEAVVPGAVFGETVTVLASRRGLDYAVREGRKLLAATGVTVVRGASVFPLAWERFTGQPSFELSFVDCAVLAVAEAGEADGVATFDRRMREAVDRPAPPELG